MNIYICSYAHGDKGEHIPSFPAASALAYGRVVSPVHHVLGEVRPCDQ